MKKGSTHYKFVGFLNRKWSVVILTGFLLNIQVSTQQVFGKTNEPAFTSGNTNTYFAGEKVISFSLINADTEQVIQTISNGATLNLATLPTKNLNIRADTYPATVGSVKFNLSGAQTRTELQTGKPYALFGDASGNYNNWTPSLGSYTLTCTPYSGANASGTAGTSLTIGFKVINQTTTALVSNIRSTTGNSYKLGTLAVGTTLYTDRTYTVTSVPTAYNKAAFIKTPNDDKYVTSTSALSFQLSQNATVYVGYDPLATKLPTWLSTWEKTGEKIGINDPRIDNLQLYSKSFPAGTVTLGGNLASPAAGSKNQYIVIVKPTGSLRPYVTAVRPADGATNVPLDQSISVDLEYPGASAIDGNTANPNTVKLYIISSSGTKTLVSGTAVNASAAGDAITLSASLKAGTNYEFDITDQVKDNNGNALIPFTSRFTTTSSSPDTPTELDGVSFTEKTLVTTTFGADGFTSLVVGPDRRLYATTSGGKIERWDIRSDGTITNHVTITPFGTSRRLLIGLTFDPAATSSNLVAWISHSSPVFTSAPDWSGKISRIVLTNPSSPIVKDYVINLPRSYKDHATNSIAFGPDKAMYFPQGSNSAMGAQDGAWGNRPERLLSGAILRLDVAKAQTQTLPINAKTNEGGTYNPYASSAALTIYATGVRNAYDLVWHTNGQLYVPGNGSAAGGNTPALASGTTWSNGQTYTGPNVAPLNNVRDTQNDYLFRIIKGGYYGHPNPLRKEYIMNGGNPSSGVDPGEVVWSANGTTYGYKVGTPKEPNYRGYAYDFGLNISPNGVIEYKSSAFGGKLKGKMIVCRFSGGDDLIVLQPGTTNKDIIRATEGIKIPGFRRPFYNPLDIIEDTRTGNLYLSEYYEGNGDGQPRITLLKANQPATSTSSSTSTMAASASPVPTTEELALNVYPNPNNGDNIFVEVKNFAPQEKIRLTLHDLTGWVMETSELIADEKGGSQTELLMKQNLKKGVYILRATSASGSKETKLFIK